MTTTIAILVLETDGGQQLSESQQVARVTRAHVTASCLACSAILSFLAKKYGLGGGTDREAAEINALAFFYTDFVREQLPYMMILAGRREGDKASFHRAAQPSLQTVGIFRKKHTATFFYLRSKSSFRCSSVSSSPRATALCTRAASVGCVA